MKIQRNNAHIFRLDLADRWAWLRPTIAWIVNFSKRKPLGAIGAAIILIMVLAAVMAPIVSPQDPYKSHVKLVYQPPSSDFLLGTDELGRDVLSRVIYGARVSLYVGIVSVLIGATMGMLVGIMSAYFGGAIDLFIQRILDALISFPGIIMAMAIMAALGSSLENVIVALVVVFMPGAARTLRSRALSLKEMDFVLAARAVGAGHWRIILRHILPNCLSLYIVFFSITVGFAIIVEASLSFLGLGAPPDVPSWGGMLALVSYRYIDLAPWISIAPGASIAVVVFAFNMLGDALRDVLDPRLRST